jgi:hypothetical protein
VRSRRALLLGLGALACVPWRREEPATLKVVCEVADATLWVDDVPLGRVGEWASGRRIRPGFHRVEIRHPSYFTAYAEVSLRAGGGGVVKPILRPLLD